MFGDVTCGRYVLLTPHDTLFFCLCGVTAVWCRFLVCWLQSNISRGEANFFKYIKYLQTRWWIEEISLVAGEGKWVPIQEQKGLLPFFRNLSFSSQVGLLQVFVLMLSEYISHWVFRTWLLLAPILFVLFLSLIVSHLAENFSFWLWEHYRVLVLVHLFNDRIKTKEYQACLFVEAFILISVHLVKDYCIFA